MIYPDNQLDTLRFNQTKSVFHWDVARFSGSPGLKAIKKEFPNAKRGNPIEVSAKPYYGIRINFFDTAKDSVYSLMGMKYTGILLYLKEKTPTIHWNIKDSTKLVGNYTVKKATGRFRGRNYTAWFTPKIPVPYGPWKLHGLPGLILQAYDRSNNIYFSAINVSTKNGLKPIRPITLTGNEQVVTIVGYKKFLDNYKRYQKQQLMKQTRQFSDISKDELAEMQYHLQPVRHMEIFTDSTGQ